MQNPLEYIKFYHSNIAFTITIAMIFLIKYSMNLNEISLKKDIKDLYQPAAILGKYGWEVLGSGLSAAVAQHPNKPYVLKLFKSDFGYMEFIRFVEENKGNRHLPVINKTVKSIPGTNLHYIRMERLAPMTESVLWGKYKPEMAFLTLLVLKNDLVASSSAENQLNVFLRQIGLLQNPMRRVSFDDIWTAYKHKPLASWVDISRKLVYFADSNHMTHLDIHSGNFMLRGHTLVITDPF